MAEVDRSRDKGVVLVEEGLTKTKQDPVSDLKPNSNTEGPTPSSVLKTKGTFCGGVWIPPTNTRCLQRWVDKSLICKHTRVRPPLRALAWENGDVGIHALLGRRGWDAEAGPGSSLPGGTRPVDAKTQVESTTGTNPVWGETRR